MDLPFPNPQDEFERGANAFAELSARAQAEAEKVDIDAIVALRESFGASPDVVDPYELNLIGQIEQDRRSADVMDWGVTPRPYYDLAVYYRKQGAIRCEIALLEFFGRQKHAPGVMPGKLAERIEKARALHAKRAGK